jgi:hypothetical protein
MMKYAYDLHTVHTTILQKRKKVSINYTAIISINYTTISSVLKLDSDVHDYDNDGDFIVTS